MAAVPVTINGVIIDYYGRTIMGPIKIVGEMVRSDVSIGGGPIIPPDEKPPDVPPPSIWPIPGDPDYPILNPPDKPIEPGTIITWTPVWTPGRGWFVIGVPNVPHPAPS